MERYSDAVPKEERKYWYFTTHGYGPGTLPKGVNMLRSIEGRNDKGTLGDYICLDAILNTSELKEYDLRELNPFDNENIDIYPIIDNYLTSEGWSGMIDNIWQTGNKVHIIIDGDWKHQHLSCKFLMEQIGYTQIDKIVEPSDCDWYTAEHIYQREK